MEMHEISFEEIAAMVVSVAARWIAVAFCAGVTCGLVIGVLV